MRDHFAYARSVFEETVQLRHHIHQNPELSGEEHNTLAFIVEHLEKLGGGFKIFIVDKCVEMCHFLLLFGNIISFFGRKRLNYIDFSCY